MAYDQRFDKGKELFKKKLCALIDAADDAECDCYLQRGDKGVEINLFIKVSDEFTLRQTIRRDLPEAVRLPSEQRD